MSDVPDVQGPTCFGMGPLEVWNLLASCQMSRKRFSDAFPRVGWQLGLEIDGFLPDVTDMSLQTPPPERVAIALQTPSPEWVGIEVWKLTASCQMSRTCLSRRLPKNGRQ